LNPRLQLHMHAQDAVLNRAFDKSAEFQSAAAGFLLL
jgi:hypothetical protein